MHIKILLVIIALINVNIMAENAINDNYRESTSVKIKLQGEALQKVLDRQAEALKAGHRISIQVAIEKLILGK